MKNWIKRIFATKPSVKGKLMQSVEIEVTEFDASELIERHQNYGFSGMTDSGANGLMIAVGGHRLVIALDHPGDEPAGMVTGDVQLWHKGGDYVRLTGGQVEVKTTHLLVSAADTTFKGDVQVDGDVNVAGDCVAAGISLPHHTHTGDNGGTTSEPH